MSFSIIQGNALEVLRRLPDDSIDMCVTSPPYWRLRSYQTEPQVWGGSHDCEHAWEDASWRANRWGSHDDDNPGAKQRTNSGSLGHRGAVHEAWTCSKCGAWRGELGSEPTPELYVSHVVDVFREVRRVVRNTLWINIGDSWSPTGGSAGIKPKDLVGIPWMLAFALRADGWYLRQEIIWEKPACMPESVKDRPTRSHEQLFLLAKGPKYYYDADAIREPGRQTRTPGMRGGEATATSTPMAGPVDRRLPRGSSTCGRLE